MIRSTTRPHTMLLMIWGLSLSAQLLAEGDLATKLQNAKVEQIVQSPGYADGPVWRNGQLLYSSSGFWKLQPEGPVKIFELSPSGSCLRDPQNLLLCDSALNCLLNLTSEGKVLVLADHFEGQPLKSLNDVTIDKQGRIYWTDPVGSSVEKPIGSVFRLTPDGKVTQVIQGLAFPAGIEVDPLGEFLFVVESQTHRVLKYTIPVDSAPFGSATPFFDVGGSGADGCVFDAAGNLWLADFHQKELGRGRLTVVSPGGEVVGQVAIPAKVVSNVSFGGANLDEVYCTTAEPPGVFVVRAGVPGFPGHPALEVKPLRELDIKMLSNIHLVRPRKVSRLERKHLRQNHRDDEPAFKSTSMGRWSRCWRVLQGLTATRTIVLPDQWKGRDASNWQTLQ